MLSTNTELPRKSFDPHGLSFAPEVVQTTKMEEFLNVCRMINKRGWSPATSGNFSLRLKHNHFIVSASGADKGALTPAHFLDVIDGAAISHPTLKPSAETLIHTWLYSYDKKSNCVLHTHSINSTVLSMVTKGNFLEISDMELIKGISGHKSHLDHLKIPIVDNDQDMNVLVEDAESLASKMVFDHAFIIRGHGLYVWGSSVAEAARHLECVEFLLQASLEIRRLQS